MEPLGRTHRHDFPETVDLLAQIVPEGIRARLGQILQDLVQDRRLELLELALGRLVRVVAKRPQLVGELFQPRLGQARVGAVFQLDVALALGPGLPDLLDGHPLVVVLDLQIEVEPLLVFLGLHFGHDDRRRQAHLVAGQVLFAVDPVFFHQLGIGVEQENDGFLGLQKPVGVVARLEAHLGQKRDEVLLLVAVPGDEIGAAVVRVGGGHEIGIGTGDRDLAMLGLIDVLDLQGEQAPLLVQEDLRIEIGRHEKRLHLDQEFFLAVEIGHGQVGPDPVQKLRDVGRGDKRRQLHDIRDKLGRQAGLDRIEAVFPADPDGHLAVKIDFLAEDRKGRLAGAAEQDVEGQAVVGELGRQLQAHGLGLDAHGLFAVAPVEVVFLADGPKKPGEESRGDFHPMPGVVEVVKKHLGHDRQRRRQLGPVRIFDDLFEGDLGMDLGDAGLVLAGPKKRHLQPTRFGMEPENEIVPAGLGFGLGGKIGPKGLAPFAAGDGGLGGRLVGFVQRADAGQGRGPDMAADPGKGIRAVTEKIDAAFPQIDGEFRGVDLEIVPLHLSFDIIKVAVAIDGKFLYAPARDDGVGTVQNIVGNGFADEFGQQRLDFCFFVAFGHCP